MQQVVFSNATIRDITNDTVDRLVSALRAAYPELEVPYSFFKNREGYGIIWLIDTNDNDGGISVELNQKASKIFITFGKNRRCDKEGLDNVAYIVQKYIGDSEWRTKE